MFYSVGVIVIGTAVVALAFVLVLRHQRETRSRLVDVDHGVGVLGVLGTGFAVLLAFVIFSAFDSYQTARREAGTESVTVRQLYATAGFFAAPQRDELKGDLICYGRAVVSREWPLMAVGSESDQVDSWVSRMDERLQAMPVDNSKQAAALSNWFAQSRDRQDARRGRLAEAAPYVPAFLWAVLALLFVVVVGYQAVLADPKAPLLGQLLGIIAVAMTLLAGMVLVFVLDAPFADRGAGISPARMQASVAAMEADYGSTGQQPPCGSDGVPVSR